MRNFHKGILTGSFLGALLPGMAFAQTAVGNLRVENALRELTGNAAAALNLTVTVPNGTARSLLAITTDVTNILDVLPQTSGSVDYTTALNTALAAAPKPVYLPNTGTAYKFTAQLLLPANAHLLCAPGVVLQYTGSISYAWATTGSGVVIQGCTWSLPSTSGGLVQSNNFTWTQGGQTGGTLLQVSGTDDLFDHLTITGAASTGIYLTGATRPIVQNSDFESDTGLGIYAVNGTSGGRLSGNHTINNGHELLGLDYTANGMIVDHNTASGTGDNCISITGFNNVVDDNNVSNCALGGVVIYGSSNAVSNNHALNAGQIHNPASPFYQSGAMGSFADIAVVPGFGGAAQNNSVTGNWGDDTQATPTAAYDVQIGLQYLAWAASTAVTAGTYVYSSGNIYLYTGSGTSGTTAPSFTSGSQADGTATIEFIAITPEGTREPSNNILTGNHVNHASVTPFTDGTTNHNNTLITDAYPQFQGGSGFGSNPMVQAFSQVPIGFQSKVTANWTSGISVNDGRNIFAVSATYRALNSGTSTIIPTCGSGVCSPGSDGISWLFLATSSVIPSMLLGPSGIEPITGFSIPSNSSTTLTCPFIADSVVPNSNVASVPCGLYLNSSGGSGNTLFIKESGTGATGWTPALPIAGTTGSIGGSALAAGACASGTATVTGATTAMAVVTSPVIYPGDGSVWQGYVSASGTATVKVCSIAGGTPTASTYNVRVSQ